MKSAALALCLPALLVHALLPEDSHAAQKLSARSDAAPSSKCTAEFPYDLLLSSAALQTDQFKSALSQVDKLLHSLYNSTSNNSVSLAVVHGSQSTPIYAFSNGRLRLNDTSDNRAVTGDSLYRADSISKLFTALTVFTTQNQSVGRTDVPYFGLSSRVVDVLPEFSLPARDVAQGGYEINLDSCLSQSSGLPREGYSTNFNLQNETLKASAAYIGGKWANATVSSVLDFIKKKGLVWLPGQRPAYSNCGIAVAAFAVARQQSLLSAKNVTWSQYTQDSILGPVGMTRSFFGPIPPSLKQSVAVPGGPNFVDLVIGAGYDPPTGMWTTANDLARFIYGVLLQRKPLLLTPTQRRQWLTYRVGVPDGVQAVGPGWEIVLLDTAADTTTAPASEQPIREAVFGKAGDGGGHHSFLSVIQELGLGVVVMTADGPLNSTAGPSPQALSLQIYDALAPALRSSYTTVLGQLYVGSYRPANASSSSTDEAVIMLNRDANALIISKLSRNNLSAFEQVDALSWVDGAPHVRFFSQPGANLLLHPSEVAIESSAKTPVTTTTTATKSWHFANDIAGECDWFDFDGFTDQDGLAVGRLLLTPGSGSAPAQLQYPDLGISYQRVSS